MLIKIKGGGEDVDGIWKLIMSLICYALIIQRYN